MDQEVREMMGEDFDVKTFIGEVFGIFMQVKANRSALIKVKEAAEQELTDLNMPTSFLDLNHSLFKTHHDNLADLENALAKVLRVQHARQQ